MLASSSPCTISVVYVCLCANTYIYASKSIHFTYRIDTINEHHMSLCVRIFMNVFLLKCAMFLLGCVVAYIFIAIYDCCYCYSNQWENLPWFDASGVYVLCIMSHVLRQHSTAHSKLNIVFNIVHKIQNAFSYSIYESCFRELPKHSLMVINIQSIRSFTSIFLLCLCKFNNNACSKQIIIV